MSDTLTGLVRLLIGATYTKDLDLSDPKDSLSETYEQQFTTGTGSNQCNLVFHDTRTLADGATEDLDLAGALSSAFGATLTFAKVKAILVKNHSATQTISIGGAATNQFVNWVGAGNDVVNIPPSGFFCLVAPLAGFAVTASTGDLLKIANSAGASANYDIILLGSSA